MKKKVFSLLMFACFISLAAFSQDPDARIRALNAEHDRGMNLITASADVQVPENVIKQMKNYAVEKRLEEKSVMKYLTVLKPLYNDKLSAEDKVFMCRLGIKLCNNDGIYVPVKIFNDKLTELLKTKG